MDPGWLVLKMNKCRERNPGCRKQCPIVLCFFVKKIQRPELRTEIIKFLSAGLAIIAMGPAPPPRRRTGQKSMETRQSQAKTAIQDLVEKICAEAIVFWQREQSTIWQPEGKYT